MDKIKERIQYLKTSVAIYETELKNKFIAQSIIETLEEIIVYLNDIEQRLPKEK